MRVSSSGQSHQWRIDVEQSSKFGTGCHDSMLDLENNSFKVLVRERVWREPRELELAWQDHYSLETGRCRECCLSRPSCKPWIKEKAVDQRMLQNKKDSLRQYSLELQVIIKRGHVLKGSIFLKREITPLKATQNVKAICNGVLCGSKNCEWTHVHGRSSFVSSWITDEEDLKPIAKLHVLILCFICLGFYYASSISSRSFTALPSPPHL